MYTQYPKKRGPAQESSPLAYLLISDVCHLNVMNNIIKFSLSLCVNIVLIPFFWRSLPDTPISILPELCGIEILSLASLETSVHVGADLWWGINGERKA